MALVSDQEFCSFEEEPEMALVICQEFCSFEELSESVKKWEKSSTMQNMHTPVSYLVDAGWELSPSGISHLSIFWMWLMSFVEL